MSGPRFEPPNPLPFDHCPRCGAEVPLAALTCQRCGLSKVPNPAATLPAAAGRRRSGALVLAILGGALVFGVAAALLFTVVLPLTAGRGDPSVVGPSSPPPSPSATSPRATSTPSPVVPTAPPTASGNRRPDFTSAVAAVSSGIFRVIASTCSGTGIGTAFLVGRDTVATSAAVVSGAAAVVVVVGGSPRTGTVVDVDAKRGTALVRLDEKLSGHVFAVVDHELAVEETVGYVGVATSATKPRLSIGVVRAVGRAGADLGGMADGGLMGAPLIDEQGRVVGMVTPRDRVSSRTARAGTTIRPGITNPSGAVEPPDCARPLGPEGPVTVRGTVAAATVDVLERYFGGINAGEYDQAYAALSPRQRSGLSQKEAEQGWRSSYDFGIRAARAGSGQVWVRFDSVFADGRGPKGTTTCARWSLDYSFVEVGGVTYLDRVTGHDGADLYRPC